MNKKNIHKLIEEKNPEGKAALRKKVMERVNLPTEAEQIQKKPTFSYKRFYRIFAGVSAAVAAVCLAIVLPIVLNRDTALPSERYCHAADCVETPIDYSIKEYSERNNLSLLYVDWYNIADELETLLFVNINDDKDVVYLQETIVNGEIGSIVILYITDLYTQVDVFEDMEKACENVEYISSVKVSWKYKNNKGTACFEYLNRRYSIELRYPMAEDSVLDLVESMLSNR
ncbi:MAG: hypothetical protein J1F61_05475 [Clostridiales bacterium]|nr:hypothetical protein [Clostridiales bacterium]